MRSVGRRKTDKWQWAAGIALGVVLTTYAFSVSSCDKGGGTAVSGPTAEVPAPVAAAPAPQPTATPSLVADDPVKAFELQCLNDSTLSVKYTGQASRAAIETFYTSFDNQSLAFGKQSHTINSGDTITRVFGNVCIQGDADQPGVKLIGGCFFDQDGKPFIPSRNPEKVTACRTVPCDPQAKESWVEDEEYSDGEWSSCSPNNQPPSPGESSVVQQCFKKKTRTWTSINICTKEKRYRTEWVYAQCECPCVSLDTKREAIDYGPWSNPNSSCGTRSKTVTTYTLNTCTQVETHTSPVVTTDSKDCPFCHVAADGSPKNANDFDVTIQTTQFNFPWPAGNPGHNSHLDPAHFCPQDYWGTCSSTVAKNEIKGIVCVDHFTKPGECKKWAFTCVVPD